MSILADIKAAAIPHECGTCGYPNLQSGGHAPFCFAAFTSTTAYNKRCGCERCAYLTARSNEEGADESC